MLRMTRAPAWLSDNFHLATVKEHDALHDRQPEACAARGLISERYDLVTMM